MAETNPTNGAENTASAQKANRAAILEAARNVYPFGPAVVKKPDYEMTAFENKMGKSCRVLEIDIPLIVGGLVVTASMYARIDKAGTSITFEAGLPRGCKLPDSFDSERFKSHALKAASAFREWDTLQAKAEAVLTGRATKPAFDKPTKLVRKLGDGTRQTVAETNTPASA